MNSLEKDYNDDNEFDREADSSYGEEIRLNSLPESSPDLISSSQKLDSSEIVLSMMLHQERSQARDDVTLVLPAPHGLSRRERDVPAPSATSPSQAKGKKHGKKHKATRKESKKDRARGVGGRKFGNFIYL